MMLASHTGCSSHGSEPVFPPDLVIPEDTTNVVISLGLLPDWNAKEMAQQADAIVIGSLSNELDTKADNQGGGDPIKYYYQFTNYEFTVEKALYPATLPDKIAVLAETGAIAAKEGYVAIPHEGIPAYTVNERVLLFLKKLTDENKYGDGASRPVPDGYTTDHYYLTIIGGRFGKLIDSGETGQDGTVWRDSRGTNSVSEDQLKRAISQVK